MSGWSGGEAPEVIAEREKEESERAKAYADYEKREAVAVLRKAGIPMFVIEWLQTLSPTDIACLSVEPGTTN